VKIPSNTPALFVLHLQKVGCEISQRLFFLHLFSHVAGNFRKTDQLVRLIPNRRDDHICPECGAILADTPAFILISAVFSRNLELPPGLACPNISLGIETRKVPANNL
jgi:hypothetical protein